MSTENTTKAAETKPSGQVDPNEELKNLQTLYDALLKDVADLQAENAKLKKQLSNQAAAEVKGKTDKGLAIPDVVYKHKNKKYKAIVAGVMQAGGEVVSTKEIGADETLLAEILAIEGQGIFKEVV